MRLGWMVVAAMLVSPEISPALEIGGHLVARGWFFGIDGNIEDTDLDALDFDDHKGQPEIGGGLRLGRRHHLDLAWLIVRRDEEGTAQAEVLGVIPIQDRVAIDLEVDYLHGGYGFSLLANDWIDLRPFIEVAWLREETDIRNATTGERQHQEESAVFPLPGARIALAPGFAVHLVARASGMATGRGHLIDVEGGVETGWRWFFGGVGWRYVDVEIDDDTADLTADGFYLRGGARF